MEYRLSTNGVIEYYDNGSKKWCNYTIIPNAKDLPLIPQHYNLTLFISS